MSSKKKTNAAPVKPDNVSTTMKPGPVQTGINITFADDGTIKTFDVCQLREQETKEGE